MKLRIYWKTHQREEMERIRNRFDIPYYMSVNRETPCVVEDKDLKLLEEEARKGFIQIRK